MRKEKLGLGFENPKYRARKLGFGSGWITTGSDISGIGGFGDKFLGNTKISSTKVVSTLIESNCSINVSLSTLVVEEVLAVSFSMDFLITDPSEKVPLEKKKHIVKDRSNIVDQISNFLGKQKHFEQKLASL